MKNAAGPFDALTAMTCLEDSSPKARAGTNGFDDVGSMPASLALLSSASPSSRVACSSLWSSLGFGGVTGFVSPSEVEVVAGIVDSEILSCSGVDDRSPAACVVDILSALDQGVLLSNQ